MKEFTMTNKSKGLIWYLAIAFAITWGSVFAIYLTGGVPSPDMSEGLPNPLVGLLSMLATFEPAIAAIVILKWITREGFKDAGLHFNFRAGWPYYLWAVLAPLTGGAIAVLAAKAAGAEVSGLSATASRNYFMVYGRARVDSHPLRGGIRMERLPATSSCSRQAVAGGSPDGLDLGNLAL